MLLEKVPVACAAVGFGVRVSVFPPFVMTAVPLLRTLPVKVPVWNAATGLLAVKTRGLFGPALRLGLLMVTVCPPLMVLAEKVPVSPAATAEPL